MNKGCPKCGRMIDQTYKNCPYCNYDFQEIDNIFKNINEEKHKEEKYAGFIKRLVSGIIDIYITILLVLPIFIKINKEITKENLWFLLIIMFGTYIIYNSLLERTKQRGSIGKIITQIEVTDEYENPITLPKAFIRNISKIFNVLTLGLGFLMCTITQSKQTLGDKISKTYILNKVKFEEEKTIRVAQVYKRIIAFAIDLIYIGLLIALEYHIIKYLPGIFKLPESLVIYEKIIYKAIGLFIIFLYFPYNESKKGKTKGKEILKIRITNMEEEKISPIIAITRYLLIPLDVITLGFLLSFTNSKHQTLKDIITKTIIIDD